MATLTLLLILCTVIPSYLEATATKETLDEYCVRKMPSIRNRLYGFTSVLHLIRLCSDIVIYNQCLKDAREKYMANKHYKILAVEKVFPSDNDTERAGYIFCATSLLLAPATYAVSQEKMLHCRKKVDVVKCEREIEADQQVLKDAVSANDTERLQEVACNMSYSYWKCLRNQYTLCNRAIKPMFNYYFARLGPTCLARHYERNFVVFNESCENPEDRPNDPFDPDDPDTDDVDTESPPKKPPGGDGCSRYLRRQNLLTQMCVVTQAILYLNYRQTFKSPYATGEFKSPRAT